MSRTRRGVAVNTQLGSTLFKLAIPAAAILIVLLVTRLRGISWGDDLGLRRPKAATLGAWLVAWLGWIVVGEALIRTYGLDQAQPWPDYPPLIIVLRILAIGMDGPLAEEIVMRGIVWHRLHRILGNPHAAIGIVAILWAAMHYRYGPGTILLIVADGVLLGYARYRGGSLWIPILMHMLANLTSIGQSLLA